MTIKVAVVGATGRMGKLALELIEGAQDLVLHAAVGPKDEIGQILGADAVLDVTLPDASPTVVSYCVEHDLKVVVGTSGWSESKLATVAKQLESHDKAAVLVVPNFSIGSMLGSQFAAMAAKFFDSIEIIEAHHAGKIDSPSGTAVRTAEMIAESRAGMTQPLIQGVGQPARGQVVSGIPVHSLRIAGVSAKQDVVFGGNDELLTISHEASSIKAYEQGILLSLRAVTRMAGLHVGLQSVIESAK
jgi:4-hydroxy-tetrahydrodipicolinate reductase